MAVSQALKAKNITPFANGTATAWQNETIVGGPALVDARQAVRRGHRVRQGELHRSALCQRAREAQGREPVFRAELHRCRLCVLAAALRCRARGDVRRRLLRGGEFQDAEPDPRSRRVRFAGRQGGRRATDRALLRWRLCGQRQVREEGRGAEVRPLPGDARIRHAFTNTLKNLSPIKGIKIEDRDHQRSGQARTRTRCPT